jgi:zinc protease
VLHEACYFPGVMWLPALFFSTLLLAAPTAAATSPRPAPPRGGPPAALLATAPTVDKLDNGLTLVTLPFDSPGVVSYFTLVRAGSRDEVEPGKSGYAHLFEHLMFRGTEKMRDYLARMQALGADNNAFTTPDFTLYVPTVPADALPELVAIDAERFQHLSYPPAAYKDETGAVLGEYNKSASSPSLLMDEALRGIAFTQHTYGHTTIGLKRDVEAMPGAYEYSRAFFQRFYTPDDCTIFAVGDVDRAKVLDQVRAQYKGWTGTRATTLAKAEPEQTAPRSRALVWKNATAPRMLVGFKTPATSASIPDAAALVAVGELVVGESSELYQRLVVKEQKLFELDTDTDDLLHRDPALFVVSAKLKSTANFDEVISLLTEAIGKVARGETSPAELERVRSHMRNALTLRLQTPQTMGIALASWTARTGDVRSLEAYADALAHVSLDDVARVARSYLTPAHRNVVTLTGPLDAKNAPKPIAPIAPAPTSSQAPKGGAK